MTDWITGEKFVELGEMVYSSRSNHDCNPLEDTFCHCKLKKRNIVYTHTMYAKDLFRQIEGLNCEFVIVTHNSDTNVDFLPPRNVVKWFTQNVNITNRRIESIPIGLENNKWFKAARKKDKMEQVLKTSRKHKNLVYMNHNIKTNPEERQYVYDVMRNKPWVTVNMGVNGQAFDQYIDDIYNHKYVLCPRGNGIDTHRLWETLYMGSVPVVRKDVNNWFYNNLPILYVNDWESVTDELLNAMWSNFENGIWDKEILTFKYWRNKILNHESSSKV